MANAWNCERHCESPYLIAAYLLFLIGSVKDILKTAHFAVVELGEEGVLDACCHIRVFFCKLRLIGLTAEAFHCTECTVPVGIYLDRLAVSWCGKKVVDAHIHPGELFKPGSRHDKSVTVALYMKIGSVFVGINNIFHRGKAFCNEIRIAGGFHIFIYRIDEQKGSIRGIVHRGSATFRKKIREQPVLLIFCEGCEYTFTV